MREAKADGNFYVKVFEKKDEEEYLEMRRSAMIKQANGFDTLRYQKLTEAITVLLVVEKTEESEIPVGYAVLHNLDDREYQKSVSKVYGIEINAKYFVGDFVIAKGYRRGGVGKHFMEFIIQDYCKEESLMMNPNEEDALFWHSVGFAFVGTDKKQGMRVN